MCVPANAKTDCEGEEAGGGFGAVIKVRKLGDLERNLWLDDVILESIRPAVGTTFLKGKGETEGRRAAP